MKNKTTIIDHAIRVKLRLNCMEYCVADYIWKYDKSLRDKDSIIQMQLSLGITFNQCVDSMMSLEKKSIFFSSKDSICVLTDKWKNEFKKQKSIEEKTEDFKKSVDYFITKYPGQLLTDFFNYWSELNKSKTKMRWELEKTWDINKRLIRWANNNKGKPPGSEKEKVTYIIK